MKCLSREDIQLLLDAELEKEQTKLFHSHIAECEQCRNLYKEAIDNKALVAHFFSSYNVSIEQKEIPVFFYPKRRIPLFIKIAAGLALVLTATFIPLQILKKETPASATINDSQSIRMNQFPVEELDHNQQWKQQAISITVFSKNGEVIHQFTSNL